MRVFFLLIVFIFFIGVMIFISSQSFLAKEKIFSKKTILFLCSHNTFRSQIAKAYFNKFAKERNLNWQAESAGFLKTDKINEKAIILMAEEEIDISKEKPKLVTDEMIAQANKIIVVCKECEEFGLCLNLPQDKDIEYWRLENPAQLELERAREIKDLIKEKTLNLIEKIEKKS